MTAAYEDRDRVVSLVAAGREETVPSGVPLGRLPLASFQTPEVRDWLDQHREYDIYVTAGQQVASQDIPSLSVPTTTTDYDLVLSEMPR